MRTTGVRRTGDLGSSPALSMIMPAIGGSLGYSITPELAAREEAWRTFGASRNRSGQAPLMSPREPGPARLAVRLW
jgi:hypothetical protein